GSDALDALGHAGRARAGRFARPDAAGRADRPVWRAGDVCRGVFFGALPVAGLALADSYNQLLLAGLFLGISGASFAIGVPFVNAWFPPRKRGLALGLYSMGNAGTAVS